MEMSNDEIVLSYRQSKNQKEQITILSQLNSCDKADIQIILRDNDLNVHMIGNYDLELVRNELIEHFENGGNKSELARKYHTDGNRINKVLGEMGILVDGKYVSKNSEKTKKADVKESVIKMNLSDALDRNAELLKKDKEIASLKESLTDVIATRRELTAENNDLKETIKGLNTELSELTDELSELDSELAELKLNKCESVPDNPLVAHHKEVCNLLNEIYEQKNRAYGNSFDKTYEQLGIISAVTRISDKFNRLCNLARNTDCPTGDESIADTLLDMANYAIMTYMQVSKES